MESHVAPDDRQKLKSVNRSGGGRRGNGNAGDSVSLILILLIIMIISVGLTTFICWRKR